jgi:hypothetical protein
VAEPVATFEAPDVAGARSGKAATDGSAGAGWIAGRRQDLGACQRRLFGREVERAAPLRKDIRAGGEGRLGTAYGRAQIVGGGSEGTQAAPKRRRADRTGAAAGGRLPHWDACPNVRTDS